MVALDWDPLIEEAFTARNNAYAPYSNYLVGAVVLGKNQALYSGCNVENKSFGLTICAERVAVSKAISDGVSEFLALVIVAEGKSPVTPCGACRQVMAEFGDFPVLCLNTERDQLLTSVSELLPDAFTGI